MRKKKISLIAVAVIVIVYSLLSFIPINYALENSFVTKVIDGDTIVLEGGQRVRLLNIDTRERGENCYTEAKKQMEELVLMKNVTLERDKENEDQYDRLLRYVYVDNVSVNLQMVKEGLAIVYIYEPNVKHADEFRIIEREARNQGGCVWTKKS